LSRTPVGQQLGNYYPDDLSHWYSQKCAGDAKQKTTYQYGDEDH